MKFSNGDLVTYLHSLQGGAIKKDYVCGMKNGETYILVRQEREFDQQQITMAAIALTMREIPLNGELMSHY